MSEKLKNTILTVIVPVKLHDNNEYILDRIGFCKRDAFHAEDIQFMLVDDGSDKKYSNKLLLRCNDLGILYLNTNADSSSNFNLSRARNYGAIRADGKFLLFLDVDLLPYNGFYQDILEEVRLMEMDKCVNRFLMCPVIYLTDYGFKKYMAYEDDSLRRKFAINSMLYMDRKIISKYSSGTSAIVVRKDYFCSLGGYNESFSGWGYEDYEFTTRMILKNPHFIVPKDWSSMNGNFMTIKEYTGWKAIYRLYGDWLAHKGIYLVHAPHENDKKYHSRKKINEKLLKTQLLKGRYADDPECLHYLDKGPTLVLDDNYICYSREFIPFLGKVFLETENLFDTEDEIRSYIKKHDIRQVVLTEPYLNRRMLLFYRWCRKNGFPFIVAGRGALPGSVYHDRTGCLMDSTAYSEANWNSCLNNDQKRQIDDYVASVRRSISLKTGFSYGRSSDNIVKSLLDMRGKKRIVFVVNDPMEREKELFYHGNGASYDEYISCVNNISEKFGNDMFIVSNADNDHDARPFSGVNYLKGVHKYQIMALSDAIIVLNSDLAIMGMLLGKPVFVLGNAYYNSDGIVKVVSDGWALHKEIESDFKPDMEKIYRFLYYLRYEFYSFVRENNDLWPYYSELRGWSEDAMYYCMDKAVPEESMLYDRYCNFRETKPIDCYRLLRKYISKYFFPFRKRS